MNLIKLLSTFIGFISIVTINGELVTLDGQCPTSGIEPDDFARPDNVVGIFNIVEQSAEDTISSSNGRVLLTPDGDTVTIRDRYIPNSGDQCSERQIKLNYTGVEGFFDVSYQAQPDSSFQDGYQGYILRLQTYSTNNGEIAIYSIILFICRDISDSQFEFDLPVYSLLTDLSPRLREDVALYLAYNDLLDLEEYLKPEKQNEECLFSDEEENANYDIL
ncbi:uncharacterized protein LOC123293700 [Chrysoperla carnea]|uniref:uncharacterized protein LOC123293700 n=1 Tax=Chrysoperla carnea TaxID=189513 RepID=UPI001D0768BF|nr:uncharacterized protein LOC123293700 [Chrysoperla carnea]